MPRFGLFLLFNVVALSTANDTKSYSQLPPDLQINQTLLKYVSADAKLTTVSTNVYKYIFSNFTLTLGMNKKHHRFV